MAQHYDELYADAGNPITVSEEPIGNSEGITEAEIAQYQAMPPDDLITAMTAMSPEKRQAVYDLMFGNRDTSLYEDDQARGAALEDTEAPGMRRMGRLYQAANPLEFLGAGAQRYRGRGMQDDARAAREKIAEQLAQSSALRGEFDLGI